MGAVLTKDNRSFTLKIAVKFSQSVYRNHSCVILHQATCPISILELRHSVGAAMQARSWNRDCRVTSLTPTFNQQSTALICESYGFGFSKYGAKNPDWASPAERSKLGQHSGVIYLSANRSLAYGPSGIECTPNLPHYDHDRLVYHLSELDYDKDIHCRFEDKDLL